MGETYFTRDLYRFLRELKKNNNRDWFQANKQRYETSVRQPMLRFIADFGAHLAKVHPRFVSDPKPTGGSMFRIYRDVRFSEDKSPYKTNAAAHFEHDKAMQAVHVPGFYLHLDPEGSFAAGGIWHPDTPTLTAVRQSIVNQPKKWKKVVDRVKVEGATLTRPPKGYPVDHPFIKDLKRKDFITSEMLPEKVVCAPDFPQHLASHFKSMLPLMEFLSSATGLPW